MEVKNSAVGALRHVGGWFRNNFAVPAAEIGTLALDGLLRQNAGFVLLLGLCPALAITTTLQNSIAMGLTTAAVLICSGLTVSLLRHVIPHEIRAAVSLVILAAYTSAADLLLQAFFPEQSDALGLFVPLIAVCGMILTRAEAFAFQHTPGHTVLNSLFTGLGYAAALAILGGVRELLGLGTLWGTALPGISVHPLRLIGSPGGGLLILGCLAALVRGIRTGRKGGGNA